MTRLSFPLMIVGGFMTMGGALLTGCGPAKLQVQPQDVVNVSVRPASGQLLFCPGDPFQVEVVAKMKDGTTCSSADDQRGCLGQEGVIDPKLVRLQGSAGTLKNRDDLVWMPPDDVLATAGKGLDLTAWIEGNVNGSSGKSDTGEAHLKPVYQCMRGDTFHARNFGAAGPTVEIAITTLSTPYYTDAALIRVSVPSAGYNFHFISPNADTVLSFASVGGSGQPGASGAAGSSGADGSSGSSCQNGSNGSDGSDGGPGSPGGDGGPGGMIHIYLDEAAADRLEGRVSVESVPGNAGNGGTGGPGGRGGNGGAAGSSTQDCPGGGQKGTDGRDGRAGANGQDGLPGAPGPRPTVETAPRERLFGRELRIIEAIEATKAKAPSRNN